MTRIAAELRYSETAFVQQGQDPLEFTLRYFTPCGEVDLCGHATIAAFGLMMSQGIVGDGQHCINHTKAGDITVMVGNQVMMTMAPPAAIPKPLDIKRLKNIIGWQQADHTMTLQPEVISTGLPDIIMPVDTVKTLNALSPDMEAMAAYCQELEVVGVHAFALTDDGHTAHVRNFAPLYGIPEEAATGTANAALTHYLHRNGIICGKTWCSFLQGKAMGRPSNVTTWLTEDGNILVGGNCRIIASGNLLL